MSQNSTLVYIHRKLTNGIIFYVGIGSNERPYATKDRSSFWKKTVKKHGYFIEVITKNISRSEAIEIEIGLISHFGRKDNNTGQLVNMTDGGDGIRKGHKHNESFKKKRRSYMMGNSLTLGMTLSKEHKYKLSIAGKGRTPHNKGKPHSKETLDKIKKRSHRGSQNHKSVRVCVDGVWYDTMSEAGKSVSNRTTVLNRCKNPKWNYFREGYLDETPLTKKTSKLIEVFSN